MTTEQTEALRLADALEGNARTAWTREEAAAELRRQHTRIAELEAQLEAIGAGGVEPLISGAARWVSVDERLPEPQKPVLLDIGKQYPIRAMWAAKHTVPAAGDDTDWSEYDEATDQYWCPEGWYEWNEHEDTNWAVSATPRAWAPLPLTSSADSRKGE